MHFQIKTFDYIKSDKSQKKIQFTKIMILKSYSDAFDHFEHLVVRRLAVQSQDNIPHISLQNSTGLTRVHQS